MVLKSRYIKELFKPASGMVIELYRNNLFDPTDIGNFAPIFAYRNTVFQSGPDYSLALGVLRSSFVISGHAKLILLNKDNWKTPKSELSINAKEKELLLLHPEGLLLSNLSFRLVSILISTQADSRNSYRVALCVGLASDSHNDNLET